MMQREFGTETCISKLSFPFVPRTLLLYMLEALSINTYGGTDISVFRRLVAGMMEHAVPIISIIKK